MTLYQRRKLSSLRKRRNGRVGHWLVMQPPSLKKRYEEEIVDADSGGERKYDGGVQEDMV